jgi:hypothetical protein
VLLLRNRIAGTVISLVGLIFLAVGAYLLVTAGWKTTTATVTACRSGYTGTGTGRHIQDVCQVTWTDGGATRDGSVGFGGRANVGPGQTLSVHVNGGQVALPSPLWVRLGTLGVGLVALVAGLLLAFRRPGADRR